MLPLVEIDSPVPIGMEECPKPWIRGDFAAMIPFFLPLGRDGGQVHLGAV
jgi:hypothetical protein